MSGLRRSERAGIALVLLFTALAAVARYTGSVGDVVAFLLAGIALGGDAWIVSFATEEVGARFGVATTGMLQSTLGNLPEFFVVLFALQTGELVVAQTALLGSILVNATLVLGTAIIAGAHRAGDGVMRFSPRLPNDTATLLLVASFVVVLAGLSATSHGAGGGHVRVISVVGAGGLLVIYALWARQFLGASAVGVEDEGVQPRLSRSAALTLLVIAGVIAAFVSDWFVHALQPAVHSLHISTAFAGLVIVAIAGNAVEHSVGVALAWRGRSELAISVIKASVGQVAAFLFPLMVLVSLATPTALTFSLGPVFTGALVLAALVVWQIAGDGEATVFEGSALISVFVILAVVAAYQ